MKEIVLQSKKRNEIIDVTDELRKIVENMNIESGFALCYVPHTTAAVFINEGADPSVQRDISITLSKLIPELDDYRHAEGNSDAHIKSTLLGSSCMVLIGNSQLMLGTWQHIFFYEGDGPRKRSIWVTIYTESK
jgi:secondary thiamine-phosphate synthase enzyme